MSTSEHPFLHALHLEIQRRRQRGVVFRISSHHKPQHEAQHDYCCCVWSCSFAIQGLDLTQSSQFRFHFWMYVPQPDFSCPSQSPRGCDDSFLPPTELSDCRIHFSVRAALAVTPSAISDNSSFLKGYIKLLQGRHFYVLFLMLLRTGFMSKNSSVTSSSCSIILTKISHCESP